MILQYNKDINVKYEVDVFVAGGGPAGVAAAVSAAENGAKVFLAESFGAFGGAAVNALVPAFMQFSNGVDFMAGGIGYEAKAGNVIGYAFSAACEEVDITVEQGEDENAVYAGFGAGINNGKNFAHYVGLTLAE